MRHRTAIRNVLFLFTAALAFSTMRAASAATPTIMWSTTAGGGVFSADGTSVLIAVATGFQMRRTSDGGIEKTITLPVGSRGYDVSAFSPDKQYVGTTVRANGITRIDLWRTSDGTLARTINSDAVRNNKALDISSGGLIAAHERFAYGGGGMLRVFRLSDGALVRTLGPYCRNSSPRAHFSPNGTYLTVQDQNAGLVRILRTSDWTTALTFGSGAYVFAWAPNSATYWTGGSFIQPQPWQQRNVPAGTVVRSILVDESQAYITGVSPDGRFFLNYGPTGDKVELRRTSDAGVQVTYTVPTNASSSEINSSGTAFTYWTCPLSGCSFVIAKMPSL